MSLSARQQRALDDIESALAARDPHMTAMFAIFTRLTGAEAPASTERLPRKGGMRWRPRLLVIIPAAAIMVFLGGLLAAVAVSGVPACASTGHLAQVSYPQPASRSAVSCPARPSVSPGHPGPGGYVLFPTGIK